MAFGIILGTVGAFFVVDLWRTRIHGIPNVTKLSKVFGGSNTSESSVQKCKGHIASESKYKVQAASVSSAITVSYTAAEVYASYTFVLTKPWSHTFTYFTLCVRKMFCTNTASWPLYFWTLLSDVFEPPKNLWHVWNAIRIPYQVCWTK